jgi:hypothetical protein
MEDRQGAKRSASSGWVAGAASGAAELCGACGVALGEPPFYGRTGCASACGARLHELCFLRMALGQRHVRCPGPHNGSCGAVSPICGWSRTELHLSASVPVLRTGTARLVRSVRAAEAAPDPRAHDDAGRRAQETGDEIAATVERVLRAARNPGAQLVVALVKKGAAGWPTVKVGVLDSGRPSIPTALEGARQVGRVLGEYIAKPTLAHRLHTRAEFEGVDAVWSLNGAEIAEAYAAHANCPLFECFRAAIGGTPGSRRTHLAATCASTVLMKAIVPNASLPFARWFSNLNLFTGVPYSTSIMLTRCCVADSHKAADAREVAAVRARGDPTLFYFRLTGLGRHFGMLQVDSIGFLRTGMNTTVEQFCSTAHLVRAPPPPRGGSASPMFPSLAPSPAPSSSPPLSLLFPRTRAARTPRAGGPRDAAPDAAARDLVDERGGRAQLQATRLVRDRGGGAAGGAAGHRAGPRQAAASPARHGRARAPVGQGGARGALRPHGGGQWDGLRHR